MNTINLQLISDLHNDKLGVELLHSICRSPVADILVVAGDVEDGTAAIEKLQNLASTDKPVIVVFGNNCVKGERIDLLEQRAATLSRPEKGFYVLHRQTVVVKGIRFVGAMLWTDGQLTAPGFTVEQAHQYCDEKGFNHSEEFEGIPFSFAGSLREHQKDISFIRQQLLLPFDGPTIVVTHHLPHPDCSDRRFKNSPVAAAYASKLDDSLFELCDFWLHGHVHSSVDLMVGKCRILCNPRGTSKAMGQWGNPQYINEMLIPVKY